MFIWTARVIHKDGRMKDDKLSPHVVQKTGVFKSCSVPPKGLGLGGPDWSDQLEGVLGQM